MHSDKDLQSNKLCNGGQFISKWSWQVYTGNFVSGFDGCIISCFNFIGVLFTLKELYQNQLVWYIIIDMANWGIK